MYIIIYLLGSYIFVSSLINLIIDVPVPLNRKDN